METEKLDTDIKNQDFNYKNNNPEILESYYCKICNNYKEKNKFYKYSSNIDDLVIKEEYYTYICKNCLPIEAIKIGQDNRIHVIQKSLNERFWNNQLKKLKEEKNIEFEDLISRIDAVKYLDLKTGKSETKRWFRYKEKRGIINPIILKTNCKNFEKGEEKQESQEQYLIFYLKKDIEILKFIKENGDTYIRTPKLIKKGAKMAHNPPYLLIGDKNKEYIFWNKQEKIKPCKICLNIRKEDDFFNSKGKFTDICKECTQKERKIYYKEHELQIKNKVKEYRENNGEKISKQRKKYAQDNKNKLRERKKRWMLENKDKVRLYRRIRNGKTENKIKRNLRRRVNKAIKEKIQGRYIGELSYYLGDFGCNKYELIKYIESKFLPGMTWGNYGPGYKTGEDGKPIYDENNNIIKIQQWQVDHIKPVCSFNLNNKQEIEKINHYTNLLPMWCEDNNKKSGKDELCPILDKEFLEKYKELEILIKKD